MHRHFKALDVYYSHLKVPYMKSHMMCFPPQGQILMDASVKNFEFWN